MRANFPAAIIVLLAMAGTWSCSLADECDYHSGLVTYSVGRHVSVPRDAGLPPYEFDEVPRNDAALAELLAMPCAALCERLRNGAPPDGRYSFSTRNVHLDSCNPVEERDELGARDWGSRGSFDFTAVRPRVHPGAKFMG